MGWRQMKQALRQAGLGEQVERAEKGLCPFCSKTVAYHNQLFLLLIDAAEFRDDLSRKEFEISGLCQTCQDKTFGK